MYVVIFGRDSCPYCVKAKELCEDVKGYIPGLEYRYVDIHEENIDKADLEKTIGQPVNTVPQIFVDEKYIGGYTEFNEYIISRVSG